MAKIGEIMRGKRKIKDFVVSGDVYGILRADGVVLQGKDRGLLALQGRMVSFTISPDEEGSIRIGQSTERLSEVDFWRVPVHAPAPRVSVNIV